MHSNTSLFKQHKDKIFSYLLRMSGDYELSRDILQETFRRYLEHYQSGEVTCSLLFTIARNAMLDQLKRNTRHCEIDVEHCACDKDVERDYLIRESYRSVLAALEALGKDERDILSLAVSSDLPYREIASIMNLTEANVKVKIHRARERIRQILKGGE